MDTRALAGPIRVRHLRPEDPNDLAFVLAQASRITAGAPTWYPVEAIVTATQRGLSTAVQAADDTTLVVLAVDEQDTRLGFLYAHATAAPFTGDSHVHVSDIVVAEEAEGRGVGGTLLQAAEAWAIARGANAMSLHVFLANTRAQDLYARMGFEGESLRLHKPLRNRRS